MLPKRTTPKKAELRRIRICYSPDKKTIFLENIDVKMSKNVDEFFIDRLGELCSLNPKYKLSEMKEKRPELFPIVIPELKPKDIEWDYKGILMLNPVIVPITVEREVNNTINDKKMYAWENIRNYLLVTFAEFFV